MMRPLLVLTALAALPSLHCLAQDAEFARDVLRDNMSLSGAWQRVVNHPEANLWRPDAAAARDDWSAVELPGPLLPEPSGPEQRKRQTMETVCVWVRRTFDLTEAQALRDGLLRWGTIRFGAAAWINGRQVADFVPVAPHTAVLPSGLLRPGENTIVLKVPGWAGVPMSASGYPLVPTGGATQPWGGKAPQVPDDIWLEFYDRAVMKWILAVPDVENQRVTFRIWPAAPGELPDGLAVSAVVRDAADGRAVGQAAADLDVPAEDQPFQLTVTLQDPRLWSPEAPNLHRVELSLTGPGGTVCDKATLTFGMRDIRVVDGDFRLNGRPLRLRGSNCLNEWNWGSDWNSDPEWYIVEQARQMNLNCFRSHTVPPETEWLDTADRHGTMWLAETPLLYNHGYFAFTPAELDVFHRNAIADATGWVTKIGNHPSIVLWVLSNESVHDSPWEAGPLSDHVRSLDPTRPHMRTGDPFVGTRDILDIHTCFAYTAEPEGKLILDMQRFAEGAGGERAISNTEYMNHLIGNGSTRWLGQANHPDIQLVEAEFCAEHTEAMRRLRFDCMLPYMYARWVKRERNQWRDDWPTPMAACLHSVMAPVLASLDVFDRNYVTGQPVAMELDLLNDTAEDVEATVEVYLTPENPNFVPDQAALDEAVWRWSKTVTFPAGAATPLALTLNVPATEGSYYLAAVTRRDGADPVVSQRVLRAVDTSNVAEQMKGLRVHLFGADQTIKRWIESVGAEWTTVAGIQGIDADVVLIWDAEQFLSEDRLASPMIEAFVAGGGRVVLLRQHSWPYPYIVDVAMGRGEGRGGIDKVVSSRVHRFDGVEHPMLRNIEPEYLWRWNGLPGTVSDETILGDLPEGATPLLWAFRQTNVVAATLPEGSGRYDVCLLMLRDRITRGAPTYDPVAERVLVNLLRP